MNIRTTACLLAFAVTSVFSIAHAAKSDDATGLYVGGGLGGSAFSAGATSSPKISTDETGRALKVYGGYQLHENFGVEAGYVRLGRLEDKFNVGGTTVKQSVTGRSLYVAGTGRLLLSESFALTGKAGISFGKTSGTNVLASADSLIGSKRSLMVSVGADYRLNRNVALTVDYERYGKLSNRVKADALLVGARFSF